MGTNIVLVNGTETEQSGKCLRFVNTRTDDYNNTNTGMAEKLISINENKQ